MNQSKSLLIRNSWFNNSKQIQKCVAILVLSYLIILPSFGFNYDVTSHLKDWDPLPFCESIIFIENGQELKPFEVIEENLPNKMFAGNPAISLTKEATNGPNDLGGNNYNITWTVEMSNTGDETVFVTSWWDDFEGINNTNGVPLTVVPSGSSISSMSGMSNGSSVSLADANGNWDGTTANQDVMDSYPFTLLVGESITVTFVTQYVLVASSSVYNTTGGDAEWNNNGTIEPVNIMDAFGSQGGLPGAMASADVNKSEKCVAYDPTANRHYISYQVDVINTGALDITDLEVRDSLFLFNGTQINVVSTNISTKVLDTSTGMPLNSPDSLKFGSGNQGVFTGNMNGTYEEKEVIKVVGQNTPTLNEGETLSICLTFEVELVSIGAYGNNSNWHFSQLNAACGSVSNRVEIYDQGVSLDDQNLAQNWASSNATWICPTQTWKELESIEVISSNPLTYRKLFCAR